MCIARWARRLAPAILALALVLVPAQQALARPCESQSDRNSVREAAAAAQDACNCAGASTHRDFVICAERITKQRKAQNLLPPDCVNEANRCAKRSVCGRPGAVTCCVTNQRGRTKCFIKRSADQCKAPAHGSATVGQCASCCQSCGQGTCQAPTIRCCISGMSVSGAFTNGGVGEGSQCIETTHEMCVSQGGEDVGPGTCDTETCATSSTTTTTTTTSTTTSTQGSAEGAFINPHHQRHPHHHH